MLKTKVLFGMISRFLVLKFLIFKINFSDEFGVSIYALFLVLKINRISQLFYLISLYYNGDISNKVGVTTTAVPVE